jgi:hypothetical protein
MRSYDGVDYRYNSNDPDKEKAAGIVANLIGFRPVPEDLGYSLSFYAGGTGVDDRLAVRCQYQEADWPVVSQRLRLASLKEAADDLEWVEELSWLIGAEDSTALLDEQCFRFINAQKHDFQDEASNQWEVFFTNESDVNSWCVVWRTGHHLNYRSFDQG